MSIFKRKNIIMRLRFKKCQFYTHLMLYGYKNKRLLDLINNYTLRGTLWFINVFCTHIGSIAPCFAHVCRHPIFYPIIFYPINHPIHDSDFNPMFCPIYLSHILSHLLPHTSFLIPPHVSPHVLTSHLAQSYAPYFYVPRFTPYIVSI